MWSKVEMHRKYAKKKCWSTIEIHAKKKCWITMEIHTK